MHFNIISKRRRRALKTKPNKSNLTSRLIMIDKDSSNNFDVSRIRWETGPAFSFFRCSFY